MQRKYPLVNNEIYHIISRSIAGYKIFNCDANYQRFEDMLNFYQKQMPYSFSLFKRLSSKQQNKILNTISSDVEDQSIQIIAYCIMPTHIHLILKQLIDNGISSFVANMLNSYSRYFNTLHDRKGPLWEGKFKNIHIDSDEQLLHLTRYIHLNPTSAGLVKEQDKWKYSSYKEFITKNKKNICHFQDVLEIDPLTYKEFVNNRVGYQKEISKIKSLILEDYTG